MSDKRTQEHMHRMECAAVGQTLAAIESNEIARETNKIRTGQLSLAQRQLTIDSAVKSAQMSGMTLGMPALIKTKKEEVILQAFFIGHEIENRCEEHCWVGKQNERFGDGLYSMRNGQYRINKACQKIINGETALPSCKTAPIVFYRVDSLNQTPDTLDM